MKPLPRTKAKSSHTAGSPAVAHRSMPTSFQPPLRTLLGPGPSDVSPRVLAALARPTIGHLDPQFIHMMDEVKGMLRRAFRTTNELTIPISAPGSAGMETCFTNLVEPGDKVIVCINGVFGGRMAENVRRLGGEAVIVEDPWGQPVDVAKVAEAISRHGDAKILAFVHAETSTGVRSDAQSLCALARDSGLLTIVDTVTSLGGIELEVDAWGADAVYSGTQKCLSAPPGLSPITFNARAVEAVRARTSPVSSWFLDLSLVMAYWGGEGARAYHHTAPVNALYGLHEALVMLEEEGIENAWRRHAASHAILRGALESRGFSFLVDDPHRLPQLNAVRTPEGMKEADVRSRLLREFDIEVGSGLGALAGKIWRVGLMGFGATRANVERLCEGLDALR